MNRIDKRIVETMNLLRIELENASSEAMINLEESANSFRKNVKEKAGNFELDMDRK